MSMEKILVPLAEGFEEIEAMCIVDVLRRADLEVIIAGLDEVRVRGAHGVTIEADAPLAEVDLDSITAVVLPGGLPGSTNLAADPRILWLVRRLAALDRTTAAIGAAPLDLQAAGVLEGHRITCHPSMRERLAEAGPLADPRVVESGSVLTSQGPGTALEFALALVKRFRGAEKADELAAGMLARR